MIIKEAKAAAAQNAEENSSTPIFPDRIKKPRRNAMRNERFVLLLLCVVARRTHSARLQRSSTTAFLHRCSYGEKSGGR